MKLGVRLAACALVLALLSIAGDQTLTRGYLYSGIGSSFTWSGSAQTWSGSVQVATCGDFFTYIKNDGTACTSSSALLLDSFAVAHAVNSVTHLPLVANNTFSNGSFASWTSANTGGCNGTLFSGSFVSSDQDGDSGLALASSANCTSPAAVVTLAQTFSFVGTPTAQTYSFYYRGSTSYSGIADCAIGYGSASLVATVNSTTVATVSSPTLDGNWHQVNGTMMALASGSNTFSIAATLVAAKGQTGYYLHGVFKCANSTYTQQPIQIDDVSLSAVY